jgi:RNA polymerase sigma-70 factor (ECF subfamily)
MRVMLSEALVRRLYSQAKADRWSLPTSVFAAALESSAAGKGTTGRDLERYLSSLHLEDLALACACASGHDLAWEHFIREQRPMLYRAADALAPEGSARDLADSLYADLYGLSEREGERRSLFRYFHGRSSLSTWLRAVLAQRHVDRVRSQRRFETLPDDEPRIGGAQPSSVDPDRARYVTVMEAALKQVISRLPARDRLRLGCYYSQDLTLAETGRVLREHEATVSRQLARTRHAIRAGVEDYLRMEAGFGPDEVSRCFQSIADDPGTLDLTHILTEKPESKINQPKRSIRRESL